MSITSSTFAVGVAQADGRSYVREAHTTDLAEVFEIEYGPVGVVAYQTVANARAVALDELLVQEEVNTTLDDLVTPLAPKRQTKTQFAARVREIYRNGSREQLARVARWILAHISNGDFTDAQVRAVFGLTAGQWTTLKTKMTTLVSNYDAVQIAVGE